MERFLLHKNTKPFQEKIALASSKSESNRALIIDALSGFQCNLQNLSSARDTQTMIRLLKSDEIEANVIDAGTTMRFLTAYYSASNQMKIMTGTPRMCERPIGILVDALRTIGTEIDYLGKEGFPPIQIKGFLTQKSNHVTIRGDVSSQYISALLMIAPTLAMGLTIHILGEVGSKPYVEMTLQQLAYFGVIAKVDWHNNSIEIQPQKISPKSYQVESDWSGASYWYSIVALAHDENIQIELLGLKENSLQGDSAIALIMNQLGVESTFTDKGVLLTKQAAQEQLTWDFTHCPDLAQTVAVCCAAKHIKATFTGIESLKIKETDRIKALQTELQKMNCSFIETIPKSEYKIQREKNIELNQIETLEIATYDDHRMAMAFAPLSMLMDVIIEEPNVVVKSYPSFWEDLKKIIEIEKL